MKTLLKVVLILIAAVIVAKLLPALLLVGGLSLGGLVLLGVGLLAVGGLLCAVGLSIGAAVVMVGLVVALVLSPVWIPVLIIVGMVALVRRGARRRATALGPSARAKNLPGAIARFCLRPARFFGSGHGRPSLWQFFPRRWDDGKVCQTTG